MVIILGSDIYGYKMKHQNRKREKLYVGAGFQSLTIGFAVIHYYI